jgi:hypothetical protein
MGGQYPSGSEFNFNSDNPYLIAQVVRSWPGKITYLGNEVGMYVPSAARFTVEGPSGDPVKAAYTWYLYAYLFSYTSSPILLCHVANIISLVVMVSSAPLGTP